MRSSQTTYFNPSRWLLDSDSHDDTSLENKPLANMKTAVSVVDMFGVDSMSAGRPCQNNNFHLFSPVDLKINNCIFF